jgi:hypothetical protein
MSRKLLAAAAVGVSLFASLSIVTTAPAQATDTCITVPAWQGLSTTWRKTRVHDRLNSTGHFERAVRSGVNGRLLDTWRGYDSCRYADDQITINYNDYSAPGSRTRGGYLRLHTGTWSHWCEDYTYIMDSAGESEIGYTCHDLYFEGDYYFESASSRARAGDDSTGPTTQGRPTSAPIVVSLGVGTE